MFEPGFPLEWSDLDLSSAIDATPRLYGVASGDGNNGVSHTWADYYVRTCDPWTLARAAMISLFESPEHKVWAQEELETDGEADYGISATLLNPPDDREERDHSECEEGADCSGCSMCEGDDSDWCSVNGAWSIVEIFLDSEPRKGAWVYDSLSDAFDADTLTLATES